VPEWSIVKDRLMKRHGVESRMSNGDTSSSSSGMRGPSDEFQTPWILQDFTTLEEYEV